MQKFLFACLFLPVCLSAAGLQTIKGTVVDPTGAPVARAEISVTSPLGVERTLVARNGIFEVDIRPGARLVIAVPGFASQSIPAEQTSPEMTIRLALAPQIDSVRVIGSSIDALASEQGGSTTIIPPEQIRERNEPLAAELLRYTPGVTVNQTGPTGSLAGLYIRGGYPTFNLVEIDGIPVNAFGGNFDFAHIASESLERVEIVRGPQSAVYGPYANSGVINFVTRQPQAEPNLDVVAEGGTYHERRFGLSGGGMLAGFGLAASASQMNTDGPVANSDYRNQSILLNATRRMGRQSLALHGGFTSNENGVPGPWGADPAHTFTGIDTVSRNNNNSSDYMAHYEADLSNRVRQEVTGAFFLNNNRFTSMYPYSFNQDARGQADARTIVSVSRGYVVAAGVAGGLEHIENTYIADANLSTFPMRRRNLAAYVENRFEFGGRLFLNAGVRGEWLRTNSIPTDGYSRPYFPAQTISSANPKLAAAYVLGQTRFHGSFGTGIRPPGGFDLAYTDNPALKPERTRSLDAGVEQRLFHDWVSLDATYFHNRFRDLIVILGGSLSKLSRYHSDNLANSRAEGAEFSGRLRPATWVFVEASYTLLKTEILSLEGSSGTAPAPFQVGQELIRRPKHSGSFTTSFNRGRLAANFGALFRSSTLDTEPAYGASNGLFRNPGYATAVVNLNYDLGRGVTAYGNLRNALNRHYEEVLGYPAPRLNFVAGMKWTLSKAR